MFQDFDQVTLSTIRLIAQDAAKLEDKKVQEKWADTKALDFYNEFKDQELKGIPGTDLAFNELLKTHVNPQDLAGSNRIIVEQGNHGWGTYRGDFIAINSDVTQTNQSSITRVGGAPIILQGLQGNDAIYGNDQADMLYGSHREQVRVEEGQRPVFEAYTYTDRRYSDHDYIRAGAGNDTAYGGGGNDFIEGNEGNDFIEGNDGHDIILGGKGNDSLYGNAGNDILVDGLGDDVLTGGEGMDVFVFSNNPLIHFEENKIADFEGHDTVVFADTFENMGLNVRADLDESKVIVESVVTGHKVLQIDVESTYVEVGSNTIFGLFSGSGTSLNRFNADGNYNDEYHQIWVEEAVESFMERGL